MPEQLRNRFTKERIAAITLGITLALGATACGGGNEAVGPQKPHATATTAETTPPAEPCEDPGKQMLLDSDEFCEPASLEQLGWIANAEKAGWAYDDPLAVLAAQESLGMNTIDKPLKITLDSTLAYLEKTLGIRDSEVKTDFDTLKQASEAYNLVVPSLNTILNDLVQYNPAMTPKNDTATFEALMNENGNAALNLYVIPYDDDRVGTRQFEQRLQEIVDATPPNQTVEFVIAATTPADKSDELSYFDDLKDIGEDGYSVQVVELTGTVLLKRTTFTTTSTGVTSEVTYEPALQEGEVLALHHTHVHDSADMDKVYMTPRITIHKVEEPADQ